MNENQDAVMPRRLKQFVKPASDISPDFRWDKTDARIGRLLIEHAKTPEAVNLFDRHAYKLTNYGYWFFLSTLWVDYTGWSDLDLWKKLFSSSRPLRETSIMKPSELKVFHALANRLTVYRAHRPGETDWISCTLIGQKAAEFAFRRGVDEVKEYFVSKADVLCLFLRRGEYEVLILDKDKLEYSRTVEVRLEA